jgi:hypothetical protein
VSFKSTGSIEAGTESDVKLVVNESDVMKDAIGTGVQVEATEIVVEGNVGASAHLHAESVAVGGQTHQTSKIFVDEARINVHRGFLFAKKGVKIGRLEGGFVEAKNVEVSLMIGGEIKALEVEVQQMGSNTKVYAVSKIEIGNMVGENNKLIIDPSKVSLYKDEIEKLETQLSEMEKHLEEKKLQREEKESLRKKSLPAISTLQKRLKEDRERRIQPKSAMLTRLKQFQQLLVLLDEIDEEIRKIEHKIEEIEAKLMTYQEMVLHATVSNFGAWREYTIVEFHLLHPNIVLTYHPKTGAVGEEIFLKVDDEENYALAVREIAL